MLIVGITYDLKEDHLARGSRPEEVAEFDRKETVASLERALRLCGFEPRKIGDAFHLASRLVKGERWDMVFNIAEGLRGRCRESQVPCLLELYGIPYTFSDPLVCALTLDKAMAKRLVQVAGLSTPNFYIVRNSKDLEGIPLNHPLFAKPCFEGTSKGIDERSYIENMDQLRHTSQRLLREYKQPVLIEVFLPGREFTTGIVGTGDSARVLGTMEVQLVSQENNCIYSYDAKSRYESMVQYYPLESSPLLSEVENLALQSYRLLECRDAGRIDIRLDSRGTANFMEANPLPGLNPRDSDLPILAKMQGISYESLISMIMESAMERTGILP